MRSAPGLEHIADVAEIEKLAACPLMDTGWRCVGWMHQCAFCQDGDSLSTPEAGDRRPLDIWGVSFWQWVERSD